MTLGHRQALAELERVRASRDSLQVALDDMRRQVRELRSTNVVDLRDRAESKEAAPLR